MAVLPTGIGPVTGYNIERSLRFNSADSAYLNRTPAGAGNRRTFTWSGWVKRSGLGTQQEVFHAYIDGSNFTSVRLNADDTISVFNAISGSTSNGFAAQTSAVFRDVSAWYHFVFFVDTTQSTVGNAVKIYVNNVQQTLGSSSYGGGTNQNTAVNATVAHEIGRKGIDGNVNFVNGYMTEINFIDGQALTPSSFGETDTNTGVWKPKAYTGTYGTNGFFLKFADNSNTTAATLGKDSSGNGNNWTPNNFSVTAGAGNDSLVDSPTSYGTDTGVGGTVRGNYCTWNPIAKSAAVLLSNGNLNGSSDASLTGGCSGTIAVTSGKWYWETTIITFDGASAHGILKLPATNYATSEAGSYKYLNGGDVRIGDGSNTAYGASYGAGDVVGVALDLDNGKVFFSKNGVFQNSGNPVSGTNPAFSSLSGTFTAWCQDGSFTQVDTWATNFGQRPFAYTAPSGFKALCTQNLPTPTIGATSTTQADDYFNAVIYSGNGTSQTIDTGLQPDFIWIKRRNGAAAHVLTDNVRGTSKQLFTNLTDAEQTDADSGVTAISSSSMTLGDNNLAVGSVNGSGSTYVAWNWKANGAGSTNTAGTITSTVSASTTSGFSIVTYTGTGANATVGHGLGVAPSMVMVKCRSHDTADGFAVWHTGIAATEYLDLQKTNGKATAATVWNSTAPASTVFSVGTASGVNTSTRTYLAYCFAPVAGYSAFGSYTGNGSADGPFVYTGFRPRFVMVKQTNTSGNSWWMFDGVRSPTNAVYNRLAANLSDAEYSNSSTFDFLSNGFKLRFSDTAWNGSGSTYIYAAFAESPFKYSLAR